MLKPFLLASLLTLSACGGGGGSSSTPSTGSSASAQGAVQGPALTPAVVQAIAEVAAKAQPCASGASDCVVVSGVERPVVTGTGLGVQPATVTPPADAPPPTTLPPPVSSTVADQLGQPCSSGASVCVSVDGVEQPPATTPPLCGPNLGGNLFPCDPRWPFPGVMPVYGATQDQVDGFNHDCQTMNCIIVRCPDGRILPFSLRAGCEVPAPATTAATTTTTTPTGASTGTGTSSGSSTGTTGTTGTTPTASSTPSTASGTSTATTSTGSAPAAAAATAA